MVSRVFEKFVLIASSVCGCCSMAVCAQEVRQAEPEARTGAANVVSWEAMTPAERQALWPMLTHEQRLFQWRQMNRAERKVFEKGLTEDEKRIIKRRFVIDSRLLEAAANRPQRKLTDDERRLLPIPPTARSPHSGTVRQERLRMLCPIRFPPRPRRPTMKTRIRPYPLT